MRSIWNGSINFGLVTIPIKLYSGSEERALELDMLDSHDGSRIRYKRINEKTGKEGEWTAIVTGYKKNDKYIILEKEDFENANMKKSKTIDIEQFVLENEVADVLFKKPYFIQPQKGGEKAYALLRKALKDKKKLGVATFVMRQKEHLSLIGTYKDALVLHVIRFEDEIRNTDELDLPQLKVSKKELDMAQSLIEQYTEKFDFKKFKDVYNEQLLKIIESKAKGSHIKRETFESKPTEAKDLMAQLKASLEKRKKKAS